MALRRLQRRFEKRSLIAAIEDFKREVDGIPIIAEGRKDEIPLTSLGFKNIFSISGKPLHTIADYISSEYGSVLILTDYDEEGKKKEDALTKLFNHKGTKTLPRYRHLFRNIFGVIKIEDINSFVKAFDYSSFASCKML